MVGITLTHLGERRGIRKMARGGGRSPGTRWGSGVVVLAWLVVIAACGRGQPEGAHDPENELPFGYVDRPTANQHVARHVDVAGWALDDTGLREVRIYVDGRFKAAVGLEVDRPDVSKAFPNFRKGTDRHGWGAIIDLGKAGPHTVLVQALDEDGATRDIGVIEVTVPDEPRPSS